MQPVAFVTAGGVEVSAVTAAEMREVDRIATEEVGLDLLMMMENAGRDLATVVLAGEPGDVTVLAGNGGNGGGGMACARHIANHGGSVDLVLDRPPDELDGAAARQFRVLEAMGVPIRVGTDGFDPGEVVLDALVGYGLDGGIRGTAAALVEALEDGPRRVVSLDVPSGLDATTGQATGPVVPAGEVVTLALPKTGLHDYDGRVVLGDIGIPAVVYERAGVQYEPPFEGEYLVELAPILRGE